MSVRGDLQDNFLLLAENLYIVAEELEELQNKFDKELLKVDKMEEKCK